MTERDSSETREVLQYFYEPPDSGSLCQGDVLCRTEQLNSLLSEVHPYFADDQDTKYFLILTQTCDLVRRNNDPPSSRYISLAAVRPIRIAILREAEKYQHPWQKRLQVIGSRTFNKLAEFVIRLLDNNEPGYFYLHDCTDSGISGDNCAFLALSIGLRRVHYDLCLDAKAAQIQESFRAKLGWLVGNIYSRVGTKEWNDCHEEKVGKAASRLLREHLVNMDEDEVQMITKEAPKYLDMEKCSKKDIDGLLDERYVPPSTSFRKELSRSLSNPQLMNWLSGRLLGAMRNDGQLARRIFEVLEGKGVSDIESMRKDLQICLAEAISRTILDDTFCENYADRATSAICANTVVKRIARLG